MANRNFTLVIHGGAGAILKSKMTPELEQQYRDGLQQALAAGFDILKKGGIAVDAVQRAINIMEDSPLFNAGKGAVFTHEGKHEQDACIMDGRTLECGSVAGIRRIKRPINLARLVMDKSPHVLLGGEGAETFAVEHGFELVDDDYFHTERRRQQLQVAIEKEAAKDDPSGDNQFLSEDTRHGTVGAVALDRDGNLAAATSSGGMTNKRFGRIGDSALIGAGTYANNKTCAVSTTGHGEYFMRTVLAYDLSALMEYSGLSLRDAADKVVNGTFTELGGTGGLIALDAEGNIAMPFNCEGMYRGWQSHDKGPTVAIYKDDNSE